MDPIGAILLTLAAILGGIVLIFLLALWHSFIFTKLWLWFLVPLFGLPEISLAQAYGLMLIVSFFKGIPKTDKNKSKEDKIAEGILALIGPAMVLGIGYFVKSYFL